MRSRFTSGTLGFSVPTVPGNPASPRSSQRSAVICLNLFHLLKPAAPTLSAVVISRATGSDVIAHRTVWSMPCEPTFSTNVSPVKPSKRDDTQMFRVNIR